MMDFIALFVKGFGGNLVVHYSTPSLLTFDKLVEIKT